MIELAHPHWNETGVAQYINSRETGFGTDPNTRARFAQVRWEDFVEEIREETRVIAGAIGRAKTQNVSILPPQTPEIELVLTREHLARLQRMRTTISNLILPRGASIFADDEYDVANPDEDREVYEIVRGVKLVAVTRIQNFDQGRARAWVIFRKVGV